MENLTYRKIERSHWVDIVNSLEWGLRVRVKIYEKGGAVTIDLYRAKSENHYRMEIEVPHGRDANQVKINTLNLTALQKWVTDTLSEQEAFYRIAKRV